VIPNDQGIVDKLLDALGTSFDLRTSTAAGTLGIFLRKGLIEIDTTKAPQWGTEGAIAQVAKHATEALDFYYRPHLFPGMAPELRLAHHLQFDLLPRELPAESPLRVAAVLESFCHLSGDLIGWRQKDDTLFVWIIDIAGHGVRAGLAAAVFHFLVSDLRDELSLGEMATELNDRMIAARNPEDRRCLYATAFMLRVRGDGQCSYTSAGHPPMMHLEARGEVNQLKALAPPIGLIPSQSYTETSLSLGEHDTLFLYTDGLLEARSPSGEEFGTERIASLLSSTSGEPLDLSRTMYERVQEYRDSRLLDDDLTFLTASLR
jgi:sigma-B regulation protein RsbU (phosphoserine phosphatase)